MDTQYKNKFSVIFYSEYVKVKNEYLYQKKMMFYSNLNDAYLDNNIVELREYKNVYIEFKCSDEYSAKLYMDGLETLDYTNIIDDEGYENLYIKPGEHKIALYKENAYPLIPGSYLVKVVINEISYYSMFKVKSKYLSNVESDMIKKDLEKEANGLAFELIKRNLSLGNEEIKDDVPVELFKFLVIKRNFSATMSALLDLRVRVNYKVIKKYKYVSSEKVSFIDSVTIKNHLESKCKPGFMKIPVKSIDYNLPENRWLKRIVKYINLELDSFIGIIENSIIDKKNAIREKDKLKRYENVANEIKLQESVLPYLNDLNDMACKMKNSINILKSCEWYNFVDEKDDIIPHHVMFQDSRYNILYKLYLELKNENFNIELDSKYSFQMKRTDKLYEMWCYIKICRLINEKLNFKITGGWIFEQDVRENKVIVPELKADTKVVFNKDDISMNFIYDSSIPRNYRGTNKEETPLYSIQNSNRPDGRLDVYRKNIYIGSIIFEFKYRDRKYLWNYNLEDNKSKNCITKQLRDYASGCKTNFGYHNRLEPVNKVFVICPTSEDRKEIKHIEDYYLTFINIKPDKNIDILGTEINKAIDGLKSDHDYFLK